jgi:hypothetical protein
MTGTKIGMLVLLICCATGCAHHADNVIAPQQSTATRHGRVLLVRGFQDWYSTGVDSLASELRTAGVDAQAFPEDRWNDLADEFSKQPMNNHEPLVLIGFSYGADDVVAISRKLGAEGRPVDLLVTIDPVTPGAVPKNVVRCINFFQSNGPMDMLPWLRGIPLARESGSQQPLENIDIRSRPDLLEPNTSHATIAANRKVHAAIVDLVLATCQELTTPPSQLYDARTTWRTTFLRSASIPPSPAIGPPSRSASPSPRIGGECCAWHTRCAARPDGQPTLFQPNR